MNEGIIQTPRKIVVYIVGAFVCLPSPTPIFVV